MTDRENPASRDPAGGAGAAPDPDTPDPLSPEPEDPESEDVPTVGDLIRAEADGIVKNGVIAAMAIGLVPVPVVDLVGVTGASVAMVRALATLYDVPFSESAGRAALASLVPGVVPFAVITGLSSLVKMVPGIGTLGGSAGVSVLSGALTYAVGQIMIEHFEAGGTLADFRADPVRARFRRAFEEGKVLVADWAARLDQPASKPARASSKKGQDGRE